MVPVDLERLSQAEVDYLKEQIREQLPGAATRQEVFERVITLFYETLRIPDSGQHACVLARAFKSCHYARLPAHYQHAADELLADTASHGRMRCLALMASRGQHSLWNDVATSRKHQCIPLPSSEVVGRAPMMSRLFDQFGLSVEGLVAFPEVGNSPLATTSVEESTEAAPLTFNAFHVPRALGSPFVPDQEGFVIPYGVESVLGLGGLLADGDIFAILLFTRVPIQTEVASNFRQLASVIRESLIAFPANRTFAPLSD